MSNITVRFVHRESRTPVLELGVEASATVGALRELLMERLASEEACTMRVFAKWHAEVEVGGRKRLIELTKEDAEASLRSMGISHLSEVHLDGPLTEDSEGLGQALAVLGAQMYSEQSRNNALLETVVAQNSAIIHYLQANNGFALLPSEAYLARQALATEEGLAYAQLMMMERYEGNRCLLAEIIKKMLIEARNRPITHFTIDRATPHKTFAISDDGTTATKVGQSDRDNSLATFRASQPLTAARHKFAVKIVEDVAKSVLGIPHNIFGEFVAGRPILSCALYYNEPHNIVIGLLPKLSDAQVAKMEGGYGYIGSRALGGWGMAGGGYKQGYWECPPFTFAKGDVVVFDLNFAAKTLTLSCGDRKAVGIIPSIKEGDELFPAVSMYFNGQKVVFFAE